MQQAETISKDGLYRGYQALTILTALLLILQPILIAQYISGHHSGGKDAHEIMANVVFLSVAAQTVICFLGRNKWGFITVIWNLVLVFLVVVQIALGYNSDDHAKAGEVHIPLGVAIFGLGLVICLLAFFDIKRQR